MPSFNFKMILFVECQMQFSIFVLTFDEACEANKELQNNIFFLLNVKFIFLMFISSITFPDNSSTFLFMVLFVDVAEICIFLKYFRNEKFSIKLNFISLIRMKETYILV